MKKWTQYFLEDTQSGRALNTDIIGDENQLISAIFTAYNNITGALFPKNTGQSACYFQITCAFANH